jgi:hypothetical protein
MANKEQITVYKSSVAVVDYAANTDFVTDNILMEDFRGYTLNIYTPIVNGTGTIQTITFECSNSDGVATFNTYQNILKVPIPELFEDNEFLPKYLRIRYEQLNVTSGSTITMELLKNTL